MEKVIKVKEEFYIEFSDEELCKLNLKKGDKLSVEVDDVTNDIKLIPYTTLELDLREFNRKTLEFMVTESVERDITVSEVITEVLQKAVETYKYAKK